MEMTVEDRKMLRETHDAVLGMTQMVRDHHVTLFGNGRPGLRDRVLTIEQAREACPARLSATRAAVEQKRALAVALLAVAVSLIAVLVQVAGGGQ